VQACWRGCIKADAPTSSASGPRGVIVGLARIAAALGILMGSQAQRASGASDGDWTELVVSARANNSVIYDPVRQRMIVFGGFTPAARNDAWALSLTGTPVWTPLTPTGTPPVARHGHRAIYDPVRDRMIVFGGMSGNFLKNDVWALSLVGTPAWEALSPINTPPSARDYHSAIYDAVRDRMIVFGGYDGVGSLRNDAWALTLSGTPAWTQLTPIGAPPVARDNHSAIYDPVGDRMVVFGGSDFNTLRNDVWALSLEGTPAWTALAPGGTPPRGRYLHSANYDPVRERMIVYAGWDNTGSAATDVWALSLAGTPEWSNLTPAESPLSGRFFHSAIYDPAGDRMIVFGGQAQDYSFLNDSWALPLTGTPAWSELIPGRTPPNQRDGMSTIWDPVRDRLLVFGGVGPFSTYHDDVWALSLTDSSTWTVLTPSGNPPGARAYHSAIYDPVRDRMLVFGGWPGGNWYWYDNDVWALSLADTLAWTPLAPVGKLPPDRQHHSAIYDPVRDRMIVFGGSNASGRLGDTWALSLMDTLPAWAELSSSGTPPSARDAHSAIYDPMRERMVVFGGQDASGARLNDVWALSVEDTMLAWMALTPAGTPPVARNLHSAIYDRVRDRMVVFGGVDAAQFRSDLWALSLAGETEWSTLLPGGTIASARGGQGAVYAESLDGMVVYGGNGGYAQSLTDAWAFAFSPSLVDVDEQPFVDALARVFPNPSAGNVRIDFFVARSGPVQVVIFDASGRRVCRLMDEVRAPGRTTVTWNWAAVTDARPRAGVYFVRLLLPGASATRKLVLLK